ncbi:ankyrin repeat domain-containing protein [Gallaecimonas mangrovi]|uniref:ankyrin repeat domain-containing protein n=1 Tax=Gallaecimonas mangrovi TaxID=2291597 RepID=UPI000E20630C|nr:ankyrin repeat domain-containing protein [Gallaecimonas mangrovi]
MLLTPFTSLKAYVRSGDVAALQSRLDADNNYNATDHEGLGLLHFAIMFGQAEVAAMLLDAGVDASSGAKRPGQPVMEQVVASLSVPILELFLSRGFELPDYIDGLPVLHFVLQFSKVSADYLEALVAAGCDINAIDERNTGLTALAFYLGNKEVRPKVNTVNTLMALGADVNLGKNQRATPVCQALANPQIADAFDPSAPLRPAFEFILQALMEDDRFSWQTPQGPDDGFDSVPYIALREGRFISFMSLMDLGMRLSASELPYVLPYLTYTNYSEEGPRQNLLEINKTLNLGLPITLLFYPVSEYLLVIDDLEPGSALVHQNFVEIATASKLTFDSKIRTLKALLAKGADINATAIWYGREHTALQSLVARYHLIENAEALVRWLLDNGAAIESHGYSAFLMAVWYQHLDAASLLADRGADLDFAEKDQSTLFTKLFTAKPSGGRYSVEEVETLLPRLYRLYQSHGKELPLAQPFYYNFSNCRHFDSHQTLAEIVYHVPEDSIFMRLTRVLMTVGWDINNQVLDDTPGNLISYWCFNANEGGDISPLLEEITDLDIDSELSGDPLISAFQQNIATGCLIKLLRFSKDINKRLTRTRRNHDAITGDELNALLLLLNEQGAEEAKTVLPVLLEMGADVNATLVREVKADVPRDDGLRRELSALELATYNDDIDSVAMLLDHGADPHQPVSLNGEHYVHFLLNGRVSLAKERLLEYLKLLDSKGQLDVTETNEATKATPLLFAAMSSDVELMRYLIEKGAALDVTGGMQQLTPLQYVIFYRNQPMAKKLAAMDLLLDAGADINAVDDDGDSALHLAAAMGATQQTEALLARGARVDDYNNNGFTPLLRAIWEPNAAELDLSELDEAEQHAAISENLLNLIRLLVTAGSDINKGTQHQGHTPLMLCLLNGMHNLLPALLKLGASVNSGQQSALRFALRHADSEAQQALLKYLDLASAAKEVDEHGNNLLHAVAEHRDHALACAWFEQLQKQYQLPYKANEYGITPMHLAAYHGNTELIKAACQQGCDTNALDSNGNTPLHVATFFNGEKTDYEHIKQTIMTLVLSGSDPLRENAEGESPLAIATQRNMQDCIGMMQLASARGPAN